MNAQAVPSIFLSVYTLESRESYKLCDEKKIDV